MSIDVMVFVVLFVIVFFTRPSDQTPERACVRACIMKLEAAWGPLFLVNFKKVRGPRSYCWLKEYTTNHYECYRTSGPPPPRCIRQYMISRDPSRTTIRIHTMPTGTVLRYDFSSRVSVSRWNFHQRQHFWPLPTRLKSSLTFGAVVLFHSGIGPNAEHDCSLESNKYQTSNRLSFKWYMYQICPCSLPRQLQAKYAVRLCSY